MKFGLAYSLQAPPGFGIAHKDLYRQAFEQARLAEELGYHTLLVVEHHFLPDGVVPNPLLVAGLLATRTERVRVGSGCLLLPLYDPIHVAEDAALIDIASGGRLILGVTTGYVAEEFKGFRQERETRGARLLEQIDVLVKAWGDGPFTFSGKFYQYEDLNVTPKPVQRPHPPVWVGASGEGMIKAAARRGLPLLASPRHHLNELKHHYAIYREALRRHGKAVKDVPVIRYLYAARSEEEAVNVAKEGVLYWERDLYGFWAAKGYRQLRDDLGRLVRDRSEVTYESHKERCLINTPRRIVEEVERYREELGMTEIIGWTALPTIPHEKVVESMRLFAREVMPQFT